MHEVQKKPKKKKKKDKNTDVQDQSSAIDNSADDSVIAAGGSVDETLEISMDLGGSEFDPLISSTQLTDTVGFEKVKKKKKKKDKRLDKVQEMVDISTESIPNDFTDTSKGLLGENSEVLNEGSVEGRHKKKRKKKQKDSKEFFTPNDETSEIVNGLNDSADLFLDTPGNNEHSKSKKRKRKHEENNSVTESGDVETKHKKRKDRSSTSVTCENDFVD